MTATWVVFDVTFCEQTDVVVEAEPSSLNTKGDEGVEYEQLRWVGVYEWKQGACKKLSDACMLAYSTPLTPQAVAFF